MSGQVKIQYLLWWHLSRYHWMDIPGWGVLEARQQDSFIDHLGELIHPSRLILHFRPSLVSRSEEMLDNLCAEFGYQKQHLSNKLESLVHAIDRALSQDRRFDFQPFGSFHYTQNELEFESGILNLHPHFFGMEPLPLKPVTRIFQGSVQDLGSPVKPLPKKSPEMKILLAILGVLWLVFLCLLFWPKKDATTVDKTLEPSVQEPPLSKEDSALINALRDQPASQIDTTIHSNLPVDSLNSASEVVIKRENMDSLNNTIRHRDCIIIVGSFTKLSNANRLSKELEKHHYTPYRGNYGRFHRVGVKFNCFERNLEEVLSELKKIYHPDSWVLKM